MTKTISTKFTKALGKRSIALSTTPNVVYDPMLFYALEGAFNTGGLLVIITPDLALWPQYEAKHSV